MLYPVDEMRQYLVEAGIVRMPNMAGTLPPCWADLEDGGAISPDDAKGLAANDTQVSLSEMNAPGSQVMEGFLTDVNIEVIVRTRNYQKGYKTIRQINRAMMPSYSPRILMGDMDVAKTQAWVGPGRVPQQVYEGYAFRAEYSLTIRQEAYQMEL